MTTRKSPPTSRLPRRLPRGLQALLLGATLLAAPPLAHDAWANPDRARAAQARGDLRAAVIEWRNAVRANPNDAALRIALAEASLDVGDGDTAEREARAALERGFDRARATSLLLRSQLALNRPREILRDFPEPAAGTEPRVAATVLAARATAHLMLDQRAEGRAAAEAAVAADARSAEAQFALSSALGAAGDTAGAEAANDRALAGEPALLPQAVLRKAAFLFSRGELDPAASLLGRLIEAQPGHAMARVQRAEIRMRQNNDAGARDDVEAALRASANHVPAVYLRGMLQARAQDWRAADETLQRLGASLPNLPDGLLLMATVKRQLGQTAQALDALQRHVARRPEDPRGAKTLAAMEMEAGRFGAAAVVLASLAGRGAADAEAFDMLGRAQMQNGRPRDAAEAFANATRLAPGNATLLSRLAAARLATGDAQGMGEAAQAALAADPAAAGTGARLLLAMGAVGRGDVAAAERELAQLDEAGRGGEGAQVLTGTIRLIRFDVAGAREAFRAAIAANPESVPARLGLARLAALDGDAEGAERLLAEVLRRDPANAEATARLTAQAVGAGPRGASARAALEAALAASPNEPALNLAVAGVLARAGELARAAALMQAEPIRNSPRIRLPAMLLLAEIRAAQGQWNDAETAARNALAEDPENAAARRLLALLVARRGDARLAAQMLEDGLRGAPGDVQLLGAAVGLAQQQGGVEAALAEARRLAARPGALPGAAPLVGDLLLQAGRAAEAAEAYREAHRASPSSELVMRQQAAWLAAGREADALAALREWTGGEAGRADGAALVAFGSIQQSAGRLAEAEALFRRAIEAQPNNAIALNNLAWILQDRDEASRRAALPLAERAFFAAPTAEVADTLGWTLARLGQAPRAVPLLRQAAAGAVAGNSPAAGGILYRLAHALELTGEREEARRVAEQVLARTDSFPERAEAERLLARLRGSGTPAAPSPSSSTPASTPAPAAPAAPRR